MGQRASTANRGGVSAVGVQHSEGCRGNKRSVDHDSEDAGKDSSESPANVGLAPFSDFHTPKRKRLKSTSKYIYQTLFLDGENSDVTIYALGREWKLHKVYLSQSPYFACMFNGSWREAHQRIIELDIPDPAIDYTALKIALGSLYRDYVFLKPAEVVGVLAAANLLQLDGLIQQCITLMSNTIGSETVCCYYDASSTYSLDDLLRECFKWLLTNLLVSTDIQLFKQITVELMCKLISHHELFVMQVEMDIYSMLKKWVFLREKPSWAGTAVDLTEAVETYFKDATSTNYFLETLDGSHYLQPFQKVKWQHIVIDVESINMLEKDRIINMDWIQPVFRHVWKQMLNVEQGKDQGCKEIPEEKVYNKLAMRCGRVLKKEEEYCWRWVGYSYGVDMLLTYCNRIITIKRNTLGQQSPHSVSLERNRNFVYRLTIASVDQSGKTTQVKSTGMQHLCLGKDEEHLAVTLDNTFTFPLYLSMNWMMTSPTHALSRSLEFGGKGKQFLHTSIQTDVMDSREISTQADIVDASNKGSKFYENILPQEKEDLYTTLSRGINTSTQGGIASLEQNMNVIYHERIILTPSKSSDKNVTMEADRISKKDLEAKEGQTTSMPVVDIPSAGTSPRSSNQQSSIANKKKGSFRLPISPKRQLRYLDDDDDI